ncbi:long-chain fatty acid-CoA ligase [Gonapodya sp. JEL0774]|nr:long-chain fatty acid-CoA ligase [Gonapodya sp. JEL0774]
MKQLTVELPGPHPPNETAIRRSYLAVDGLVKRPRILDDPEHGIDSLLRAEGIPCPPQNTVHELMVYAAYKHKGKPGIGYRDLIDIKTEVKDGKTWSSYQLSSYRWLTTDVFVKAAWKLGEKFKALGYGDKTDAPAPRRMLLFANSSHEWTITAQACFSQGITVATLFTALGADGLTTACRECEPLAIFTTPEFLPIIIETASAGKISPRVRTVILSATDMPVVPENDKEKSKVDGLRDKLKGLGWTVHSFLELVGDFGAVGDVKPPTKNLPKADDEAVIMYTSGTTGDPKGILLTHGAICATVGGAELHIGPDLKHRLSEISKHYPSGSRVYKANKDDVDVYMAFLPTSHILEFVVVHALILMGCPLGTARVRTLLSATVPGCKPDIQELAPTIMAGVPTIWERIRKQVGRTLASQSPLVQNLFAGAIVAKRMLNSYDPFSLIIPPSSFLNSYTANTILKSALDRAIFAKVRAVTGGRLRACLSGGAPLAPDTRVWMTSVLCPVLVGYGLTENCAMSTLDEIDHVYGDQRSVGGLAPHIEMKFIDFEDGGYFAKDGKGEILTRGPSHMREYFKRPDLTAESIDADGWFRSGDIGEWLPDGALMIIDRRKNLIKLSHGEYIAVERLESLYTHSKLVHNICLYAHPSRDFAIAIVVPDENVGLITSSVIACSVAHSFMSSQELRKITSSDDSRPFHDLCKDSKILAGALKTLQAVAKEAKLAPAEIVKGIVLDHVEWTVDNGIMTPSSKVKRREVEKKYAVQIAQVYDSVAERN